MVCANSPAPYSLDSLKKDAIKNLYSVEYNTPEIARILIIGTERKFSWRSLSVLDKFEVDFVDSVHYMLRSGIYQNYSLFGFEDTSYEVSVVGLKELLKARTSNSKMILEFNQLKEMTNDHFRSLLSEISSEHRIQSVIALMEKDLGDLNIPSGSEFDFNQRVFESNTESILREYLRYHIKDKDQKPENILKGAINLIRPQK